MDNNNNGIERKIDIDAMLRNVFKQKLKIFIIACLAAMVTFVVSNIMYTPTYRTSSTLIITDSRATRNVMTNLNTTNELAGVLSTIFNSDELQQMVAEELGYESLPGIIRTNLIEETNFFIFSVDASNPRLSYEIFQKINEVYPQFTKDVIANAVITVFEPPVVPTGPISSNNSVKTAFMAFLAAIALSIVLVCLYTFFRSTIKSASDIKSTLGVPFAPEIPLEKDARSDKRRGVSIMDSKRSAEFVEAYRGLRTVVESARVHNGVNTIAVTSSVASEGKTSVAANLALSLAQIDKRVLLLDCNFANPAVSSFFGADIPENAQLSTYLSDRSGSNKMIHKFRELPLYIAANRGPSDNSTELIASKQMENLIVQAKQRYDYVIVDTPALSEKTDAQELSVLVDSSILVIRNDLAMEKTVKNSYRLLTADNKLLCCVFNCAEKVVIGKSSAYTAETSAPTATKRRKRYAK